MFCCRAGDGRTNGGNRTCTGAVAVRGAVRRIAVELVKGRSGAVGLSRLGQTAAVV